MSKKEVATIDEAQEVATYDYGDSTGFEQTTGADLTVPFVSVLQALSPAVTDEEPEGARPGMLINSVTRELYDADKGIVFQPAYYETTYVEWIPREDGGGRVGNHDKESDVVRDAIADNDGNRFGRLKVGENDLIETTYCYGNILEDDGDEVLGFACLTFTSTKLKVWKNFHTAMFTLKGRPPIFANRVRVSSKKEKNDHGTFFNFKVEPFNTTFRDSLIPPSSPMLAEGAELHRMVKEGLAVVNYDATHADAAKADPDAPVLDDDEIPF